MDPAFLYGQRSIGKAVMAALGLSPLTTAQCVELADQTIRTTLQGAGQEYKAEWTALEKEWRAFATSAPRGCRTAQAINRFATTLSDLTLQHLDHEAVFDWPIVAASLGIPGSAMGIGSYAVGTGAFLFGSVLSVIGVGSLLLANGFDTASRNHYDGIRERLDNGIRERLAARAVEIRAQTRLDSLISRYAACCDL